MRIIASLQFTTQEILKYEGRKGVSALRYLWEGFDRGVDMGIEEKRHRAAGAPSTVDDAMGRGLKDAAGPEAQHIVDIDHQRIGYDGQVEPMTLRVEHLEGADIIGGEQRKRAKVAMRGRAIEVSLNLH